MLICLEEHFNERHFGVLKLHLFVEHVLDELGPVDHVGGAGEDRLHGEVAGGDLAVLELVDVVGADLDHFFFEGDHVL